MIMKLQINEDYRITTDEKNVMLEQRKVYQEGKNKGQEYYNTIGYYGTLEGAFNGMLNHRIRTSDASSYKELIKLVAEVREDIKRVSMGL